MGKRAPVEGVRLLVIVIVSIVISLPGVVSDVNVVLIDVSSGVEVLVGVLSFLVIEIWDRSEGREVIRVNFLSHRHGVSLLLNSLIGRSLSPGCNYERVEEVGSGVEHEVS